jgi:hypothetical protein
MTEQDVLRILEQELRANQVVFDRRTQPGLYDAIRRAALRIARDAQTDQRRAAHTASMVGAMVTRGRTRL